MTLDDINSLIYFCENKFGTINIPFITVIEAIKHEADICQTNVEHILYYEYIRHEEIDKKLQYFEQQEQQEQDYVDSWWQWDEK